MLDFSKTQILESREFPVKEGYTITAEGQAVMMDHTPGSESGVRAASTTAGEKLLGFTMAQQLTLTEVPEIVNFTLDGTTYILPHTPVGGTILVYDETADAAITAGDPSTTAGTYSISGKTLTFNAAEDGNNIRVQYRFEPTTLEAQQIQGDIPPGGASSLMLESMGVILKGQVATTEFDTSVNWDVANIDLRLGSNGRLTVGGSGVALSDVKIIEKPTDDNSYLVLEV